MRIETHHGRQIVCGHIFGHDEIKVGQVWQGSSGSTVVVIERNADWVKYRQWDGSTHTKEAFAFQCRYCLVVESESAANVWKTRTPNTTLCKTSELSGHALNWAVDIAEGRNLKVYVDVLLCGEFMDGAWLSGYYSDPNQWVKVGSEEHRRMSSASTDWNIGGPIIEREGLPTHQIQSCDGKLWKCCSSLGTTLLIAAMRGYVAGKLGDVVEIPDALL